MADANAVKTKNGCAPRGSVWSAECNKKRSRTAINKIKDGRRCRFNFFARWCIALFSPTCNPHRINIVYCYCASYGETILVSGALTTLVASSDAVALPRNTHTTTFIAQTTVLTRRRYKNNYSFTQ